MKKSIVALLVASAVVLYGCGETYPSSISVYNFKTATVKYEISGSSVGEETLFVRGDQKAIHRYVTNADGTIENKLELRLGNESYIADLDKMTAVKTKNDDYEALTKMNNEDQKRYLIKRELGLRDGVDVPEPMTKTTVAGMECEVYEVANIGAACIWNGILLNKEVSMLGMTNKKTASYVEVDADIPDERFELPAGVIMTN